jgi:hypothetical protein
MKKNSLKIACLLILASSASIIPAEAPSENATPSTMLSWFKSLRRPNRIDIQKAKTYVKSKWRCLRHGDNCSKKERVALGLLAAATTALAAKGIHSAASQELKVVDLTTIIPISEIQKLARPNNGEIITYSDVKAYGRDKKVRYVSGSNVNIIRPDCIEFSHRVYKPTGTRSGFFSHDALDKELQPYFTIKQFVATYMIQHKYSKAYIKAQIGYKDEAQAQKFIANMNQYLLTENPQFDQSEYTITKSVDERLL